MSQGKPDAPTTPDAAHRYTAQLAQTIETRWQAHWKQQRTFRQPNPGEPGFDASRPKFYCLDMFPYPSGAGLHVGHPEGYTASDIISRYKRMRGFNVLHPMGWDAFGLPAEQYAIQTNIHPATTTRQSIDNFRRQLQRFGFAYDWDRELGTIDPEYYRWTQWIFLQLYGSYYDTEARQARPIEALVQAFERGERRPCFNPDAAELTPEAAAQPLGSWQDLDPDTRRRVVDSWRLAYVAEQIVNWCPKLGTALANEEVIDGKSERGGHPVLRKPLKQWMFRITAYAERLLEGLERLDWPEATKLKQRSWIGKSEGAEIDFRLATACGDIQSLRVFTTRPDTLFGVTYMVLAPEHPLIERLLASSGSGETRDALRSYVEAAKNRSELDRQMDKRKTGVPTGLEALHPATGKPIPIYVADYVLMGYGHGAIMAVPAHDERDWEFAEAFGLPIEPVVKPADPQTSKGSVDPTALPASVRRTAPSSGPCFSGEGVNINSANDRVSLNGLPTAEAKRRIVDWLEAEGLGRRKVNYKLRDWLFSRQRYWGEPFPVVYDAEGRHHPVSADRLPVTLPELADYKPEESDEPRPLLAKAQDWVTTTAGEAGVADLPPEAPVTRETNTMPGWAGSCWYFIRYCDSKNPEQLASREALAYWLDDNGVDLYIGGAEHAVLHLLYARFWHQVLYDLGHVPSPEPFHKLFHQGLITSFAYQRADKSLVPADQIDEREDGTFVERASGEVVQQTVAKMSKSLKNVVNPDDVIGSYGADTFRLYEMYMGPLEASKPWNTRDISGLFRFLQRAWRLVVDEATGQLTLRDAADDGTERQLHRTIAKVEEDIERLAFNTAIASMIKLVNHATSAGGLTRDQTRRFALIMAPFAPHFAEELWHKLGEQPTVAEQAWPIHDPAMLVDAQVELPVSIQGKVRSKILIAPDADREAIERLALADPRVQALVAGKSVRKVIVVPGRMVNIVTG